MIEGKNKYNYKVLRLIFFFQARNTGRFFCIPWRVLYSSYLVTRKTGNNMDHLSSRLRKLLFIINLDSVATTVNQPQENGLGEAKFNPKFPKEVPAESKERKFF